MIFAEKPKKIRVMFTPFRDGLQSSFGGKVRLNDFLRRGGALGRGRHPSLRVRGRRPLPGSLLLPGGEPVRMHAEVQGSCGPGC